MPDKNIAEVCDNEEKLWRHTCYACGGITPFEQGAAGYSCPFCGSLTLDGVFAKKKVIPDK